jgi:hypothetical protein
MEKGTALSLSIMIITKNVYNLRIRIFILHLFDEISANLKQKISINTIGLMNNINFSFEGSNIYSLHFFNLFYLYLLVKINLT